MQALRAGAYLGGGLIRDWGGGGAYLKSFIFVEIYNNFPNFTITPITETEQGNGFVSPF